MDYLIIGLGNPGPHYAQTRHNAGFLALERLARLQGFERPKPFKSSLVTKGVLDGRKLLLAWPQTYMNLSGQAAAELASFYKLSGENILALHDEMDLPLGRLKMSFGGGTAGHNGLASLKEKLREDFCRLKIGIGRPPKEMSGSVDYVLGRWPEDERSLVDEALERAAEAAALWVSEGLSKAQLKINRRPPKASAPPETEAAANT